MNPARAIRLSLCALRHRELAHPIVHSGFQSPHLAIGTVAPPRSHSNRRTSRQALAIFQEQGFPRYVAITLCYMHNGFTKQDCGFIFNCGHKLPIIAARAVEDRAIIDPDFRTLYRTLIKESKHE